MIIIIAIVIIIIVLAFAFWESTSYHRYYGGDENQLSIITFNVMSERASQFALGGVRESPAQYTERFKNIIIRLREATETPTDLILLQEVTDRFLREYLEKFAQENEYTILMEPKSMVDRDGRDIMVTFNIDGKSVESKLRQIQNIILVSNKIKAKLISATDLKQNAKDELVDQYRLPGDLELINNLDIHNKIIGAHIKINSKQIVIFNVHFSGEKSAVTHKIREILVRNMITEAKRLAPVEYYAIIGDFNNNSDHYAEMEAKGFGLTSYSKYDYDRQNKTYSEKSVDMRYEDLDKIITNLPIELWQKSPADFGAPLEIPYRIEEDGKKIIQTSGIWPSDHAMIRILFKI